MTETAADPPDDLSADAIRTRAGDACERCGITPDRACYLPPRHCPRPEILRRGTSVSDALNTTNQRDNGPERKTAPAGNRGLTSRWTSRQEADVDIIVPRSNTDSQARETHVEQLQRLLADAIRLRAQALELIDRHWFVPEAPDGYVCAACALPERNGRHAERPAGAR